ncbi:MAG: hypothetical protein C5B49_16435 [Bdellovibrio sp.]|nr:MAG: hypothetical protein C5B49_16435 [Bdellovibrio sp.]
MSYPTAQKYVNVLESSRLVFRLPGYQFGAVKRQIKSNKYYFSDVSIASSLGVDLSAGQRLELFVISELEKRRKLGRFKCDGFHFFESEKGSEIDVVIDEGRQVTLIEIKNTERPSSKDMRTLKSFELKKRARLRRILITHANSFFDSEGVEHWPVTSLCGYL